MDTDAVSAMIRAKLSRVVMERHDDVKALGDRPWTSGVKAALCDAGHECGFKVAAAGCAQANIGEWLFDVVWYETGTIDWSLKSLPLVAESEWDPHFDAIAWDFEKILVAKATLKLMVFQQPSALRIDETCAKLSRMVDQFSPRTTSEKYLLAGYCFGDREFLYRML